MRHRWLQAFQTEEGKQRTARRCDCWGFVPLVEAAIRKGPVHETEDDSALRERAGTRATSKNNSSNLKLEPPQKFLQVGCENSECI